MTAVRTKACSDIQQTEIIRSDRPDPSCGESKLLVLCPVRTKIVPVGDCETCGRLAGVSSVRGRRGLEIYIECRAREEAARNPSSLQEAQEGSADAAPHDGT